MKNLKLKLLSCIFAVSIAISMTSCDDNGASSSDKTSTSDNNSTSSSKLDESDSDQPSVSGTHALGYWMDTNAESKGNGEVYNLTFKVKDGAAANSYKVSIKNVDSIKSNNDSFDQISYTYNDGSVVVGGGEVKDNKASGSSPALTIANVAGTAGQQVEVPVTISGNPGILGLVILFEYDSTGLEIVSIEKGDTLENGDFDFNLNYQKGPMLN